MKEIINVNEWLYSNLDLVEECKEKNIKPVILVSGASSSGKSYSCKVLQKFLDLHQYNSVILSTDNYNNGIAKNIFNIVNKKYFKNTISNCEEIVANIKKIIINSDFTEKFSKENLENIKDKCEKLLNVDVNKFLQYLKFEFQNINFDKKNIYNLKEVSEDLRALIHNETIKDKQYSKVTSERVENENVIVGKNIDVVIVEGIYALDDATYHNIPKDNLIKNFVDCNMKNLFLRRMIRDMDITNCPKAFILKNYLSCVMPEYMSTILPAKQGADLVLQNDRSFEELRKGKLSKQQKFKIEYDIVKCIIDNSKDICKIYQEDIYFGKQSDNDILRLRLEGKTKNNLQLKSLIYKGQKKIRKDNVVIRPLQVLCEKQDLQDIFTSKQDIIENFKKIGIESYITKFKTRYTAIYKGKKINIDWYNNDKIYLEIDDEQSEVLAEEFKHSEKVEPLSQF